MNIRNTVRNTFLASALVLASLPGCQGEDPPEARMGAVAQELTCVNAMPIMTGSTAPAGVVTRSSAYSAEYEAWKAFDDPSSTSMWISARGNTPAYVDAVDEVHGRDATLNRFLQDLHQPCVLSVAFYASPGMRSLATQPPHSGDAVSMPGTRRTTQTTTQ